MYGPFSSDTAENRADPELLKPLPKWDLRNRVVYPPIEETKKYYEDREEECPRIQPPFVVHSRQQIKVLEGSPSLQCASCVCACVCVCVCVCVSVALASARVRLICSCALRCTRVLSFSHSNSQPSSICREITGSSELWTLSSMSPPEHLPSW